MVFVTFFGEEKTHVHGHAGIAMTIPLVVLAILSLVGGFIELPHTLGHLQLFTDYLKPVLPVVAVDQSILQQEWIVQVSAAVLSLSGVYLAYYFYVQKRELVDPVRSSVNDLYQFWYRCSSGRW
jgi:NADH-quinone oxidoreductase subunit L